MIEDIFELELFQEYLIPFLDSKPGQFLFPNGEVDKTKDIELWVVARELYTFSKMLEIGYKYNLCIYTFDKAVKKMEECLELIISEFKDNKYGGFYSKLSNDYKFVLDENKQLYDLSFVILALTQTHAILVKTIIRGGELQKKNFSLLKFAVNCFFNNFWNEKIGLARDSFDRKFKNASEYHGINANIHILESLMQLRFIDVQIVSELDLDDSIDLLSQNLITIAEENNWRLPEHFDKFWNPDYDYNLFSTEDKFKPYGTVPGHSALLAALLGNYNDNYKGSIHTLLIRAHQDAQQKKLGDVFIYTVDFDGQIHSKSEKLWVACEFYNSLKILLPNTLLTHQELNRIKKDVMLRFLSRKDDAIIIKRDRDDSEEMSNKADLYHILHFS